MIYPCCGESRRLQVDYNLFGMGLVHADDVLFRAGLPTQRQNRRWKGWNKPGIAVEVADTDEPPVTVRETPCRSFSTLSESCILPFIHLFSIYLPYPAAVITEQSREEYGRLRAIMSLLDL